MSVCRAWLKNSIFVLSCAAGVVLCQQSALARDAFIGPRAELRGTWSELLANDYNAGYCYAYIGSNQCVSYPSKKLSSQGSVGGEVGYDAPLSSNATIGAYARYDFGSGSNQDGDLTYTSRGNFAIGAKVGLGRTKSNVYFKLGYQNWAVNTTQPGNDPPIVGKSHLSGIDIAVGGDVLVTKKIYFGGEIGGGVLGGDSSVSGLDTGLKTLHVAVKVGTHF